MFGPKKLMRRDSGFGLVNLGDLLGQFLEHFVFLLEFFCFFFFW